MIHEIDDALRTLIKRDALRGTDVEVVFDAPTKDWSSRRNAPTIDIYLYDIREDLRRREVGRIDVRDDDGRVLSRREPPHWYKLSYLVTAWTQRPEDEHRLLAALLQCFLRHDKLPTDVLGGTLAALEQPIPITCALPPPEDRALSDVWSALGGELKPSLDIVLISPFDTETPIEVGPPVTERPRLVVAGGAPGAPVAQAGSGETAAGSADRPAARGSASKRRSGGGRAGPGEGDADSAAGTEAGAAAAGAPAAATGEGADVPVAHEERAAGARDQPGRRLRITEIRR